MNTIMTIEEAEASILHSLRREEREIEQWLDNAFDDDGYCIKSGDEYSYKLDVLRQVRKDIQRYEAQE